jgi:hypothetical protein
MKPRKLSHLCPQLVSGMTLGLLALAGCGGLGYSPDASRAGFFITSTASDMSTNQQVSLSALSFSGEAVPVVWSVKDGDNASTLGEGRISAKGIYTPPNALSRNQVTVRVSAAMRGDPSRSVSISLHIHPGFVQPLLPEVATLSLRSSLRASAQITEVGAGSVNWSLSSDAAGTGSSSGLGALTASGCEHFDQQYTTCTVTYSAPAGLPSVPAVYLIAAVNGTQTIASSRILINDHGLNSTPAAHQAVQGKHALLGGSGGNDNDYDTYTTPAGKSYIADCCGGTLGALVKDAAGQKFILSNNHVFAESDQAKIGDVIDQPGLMDGACIPLSDASTRLHAVGRLRAYLPLSAHSTNVDAALASIDPGAINSSGAILELGPLHDGILTPAPPMAGTGEALAPGNFDMPVVKSGRTTGLTCSHISAVDLAVKVNYYKDCAETQPYESKIFHGQIAIEGADFTDSGDSGALVLDARNAEGIGMYFAGGTNGDGDALSLVNPIHDVLSELSREIGSPLQLVGTAEPHPIACIHYGQAADRRTPVIPEIWRRRIQAVLASAAYQEFLHRTRPGAILGTAAGASLDERGRPALILYLNASHSGMPIPNLIDGVRTQVIVTTSAAIDRGEAPRAPAAPEGLHLSARSLAHAESIAQQRTRELMRDPAILGVGVAQSLDRPSQAALLVLVEVGRVPHHQPAMLDGLRVRYLHLRRFHVTRERREQRPVPSSCSLSGVRPKTSKPRN